MSENGGVDLTWWQSLCFSFFVLTDVTLPETNVAPENRPLEKEIPIGNHHFQVPC